METVDKSFWEVIRDEKTDVTWEAWEQVRRKKVPGGWLVAILNYSMKSGLVINSEALTFMPDAGHTWIP